jgi:hypothetical protein
MGRVGCGAKSDFGPRGAAPRFVHFRRAVRPVGISHLDRSHPLFGNARERSDTDGEPNGAIAAAGGVPVRRW